MDDVVSKNIPADVKDSKWYHPVNGRVVASGKVVKDLSFKGIEDIKINVASSNSVVVGCGWDIEKNEVFFTCDGSMLGGSNVRSTNTASRIDALIFSEDTLASNLVYPAIRFPGNSGLKATVSFGNNTFHFAYKCPPIGLKSTTNTEAGKLLSEWIELQQQVSAELPIAIEGSEKEIQTILVKKTEKIVKRNIECSTAVIDSRRVANELREVLAGHSIQVLMLLAQRYGLKKDRAITAAFERPDQLAEIRDMVESGDAFADYDDYSHLELVVTEDFVLHKLIHTTSYEHLSYPGVQGASICVEFDESNQVKNPSELNGKWCVVPASQQKAGACLDQIQNVLNLSPLGILWLIGVSTKFDDSNISKLNFDDITTQASPIIAVKDRDDGRVGQLGSDFRFSIGLRMNGSNDTKGSESLNDKDQVSSGLGEDAMLKEECQKKPFLFKSGSSAFCTADEDAEERVAMIAMEEQEDLECWLADIERHLNRSGVDATQVDAIISNLRDGDPNGIGMMSLEEITNNNGGRLRLPKKPVFDSSKFDGLTFNQKMRVEDISKGTLLRVTDAVRMKMNGPECLEVGDSVNVCASPMDTYKYRIFLRMVHMPLF